MISNTRILVRMRDVGISLKIADDYNQWLTRTQLQKFIYLLDVVSLLYDLLPPSEAHLTYKYGPYDAAIQNAADCLAFRGFVKVHDVHQSPKGDLHTRYQLTREGELWIEKISKTIEFAPRWEAACEVGRKVNDLGWSRLVDLVYAEPTFVSKRNRGYGQALPVNNGLDNSAAFFIAAIKRVLVHGFEGLSLDRRLVVELFFRYLDEYDHARVYKSTRRSR